MKKFLVITGPTSTGKTDLALQLADKFGGEIVSCDSRQVYQDLDIGTGKIPGRALGIKKGEGWWEIGSIKVWMYDVIDFKTQYTVADYVKEAKKVIEDIQKKGKLPILVGGTGLYLKALIEGFSNLTIPVDKKLRNQLEKLNKDQLQEKLKTISPERWQRMNSSDSQNPRRLIRAIELVIVKPEKRFTIHDLRFKNLDILKIGLTADRGTLYQRSDKRVIARIKEGMIEEAINLYRKGLTLERMKQLGLEYGVLADYLQGIITDKASLTRVLQQKIHGYIKRQLTWFNKERNINWFDITKKNLVAEVENVIGKWYHHSDAKKD